MPFVLPRCTAPVPSRSVGFRPRSRRCGKPMRSLEPEGPRCASCCPRRPTPQPPDADLEPDFVRCNLACSCGERCELELPGDRPARVVLSELCCPACGRQGALAFHRHKTERTLP